MRTMLVLRQLTAVLDRKLAAVTRSMRLTPHDVLVLGWITQIPGISGSNIASRVGRTRQNMQSSLERLERAGLVERNTDTYRGRSVGWELTKRGSVTWDLLVRGFEWQELKLVESGVTRQLLNVLDDVNTRMTRASPHSPQNSWGPGLLEVAQEEEVALGVGSGEVELPAESDEM